MHEILLNPVVQSALIPFALALVLVPALSRWGAPGAALAVVIGWFVAAAWIVGLQLSPLTSARKIVLLGPLLALFGAAVEAWPLHRYWCRALLAAGTLLALAWVLWPVLSAGIEGTRYGLMGTGAAFVVVVVLAMDTLRARPSGAAGAAVALATGVSVCAVFGASALLGQLAGALAAAAAALWVVGQRGSPAAVSRLLTLPVASLCGVIACAAVVYARFPWPAVLPLLLIPWLGHLPLSPARPLWLNAVIPLAAGLAAAGAAILIAWKMVGGIPL